MEIKHSDRDKMTRRAMRRNVKCQARQIWKYIEVHPTFNDICPGIVSGSWDVSFDTSDLPELLAKHADVAVRV